MMPPEENQDSTPSQPSRSMVDQRYFAEHSLTDGAAMRNGVMMDWQGWQPQQPEILTNPLDPLWLLHSFRRRWILATGLGLLVATAVAALAYWLTPATHTALAIFEVKSKKPNVVFDVEQGEAIGNYELYQGTQVNLVESQFVLTAALRDGDIVDLPAIRTESNKVAWLQDRLNVAFLKDSELMQVSMTGDEPGSELIRYVQAVVDAYQGEVLGNDRKDRQILLDSLKRVEARVRTKLEDLKNEYIKQARALKSEGAEGIDVDRSQVFSKLDALNDRLYETQDKMANEDLNYRQMKRMITDPAYISRTDQERMAGDVYLQSLYDQISAYQVDLARQRLNGTKRKSPAIKRLEKKIEDASALAQQRRSQLQQQYNLQHNTSSNDMLRMVRQEYEEKRKHLAAQEEKINKDIADQMEEAKKLGTQNARVEMLLAEIEKTREVQGDMATRIDQWEIEEDAHAPKRINLVQNPVTIANLESNTRYIIVALAWLFGFALTGVGIAYIEFQARRLNGPKQLDEGLGIRVVGSLPSLAFRDEDDTDPLLAVLMESIDNVRTALMHDSTAKERRIIMITSATGHEGRTTVASQLAASLARAGRRTLLVDGDLRHPSLHSLFDVPLEDGLSEVLRAEADVDDVVRPTHAEGLWLLTAGFCDVGAIQAMAKDQLQPIFDKLRNQFDFIIIDAAPALNLSDALVMGQYVDGAIVSVLRDVSKVPQVHQVNELLRSLGISVFGAVVNGVRSRVDVRTHRLHLPAPDQVADSAATEVSTEA